MTFFGEFAKRHRPFIIFYEYLTDEKLKDFLVASTKSKKANPYIH